MVRGTVFKISEPAIQYEALYNPIDGTLIIRSHNNVTLGDSLTFEPSCGCSANFKVMSVGNNFSVEILR